MPAVPAVPMTRTGTQRCESTEANFPIDQGASIYSGPISPPIEVPNQTFAR